MFFISLIGLLTGRGIYTVRILKQREYGIIKGHTVVDRIWLRIDNHLL